MNTYNIEFRNRINLTRNVGMVISAPSRNQAVKLAEERLLSTGKRLQWYQRPTVTQRGD